MAGFGAYMLAGAAGGLGAGLIEQARNQRDLSMKMLERQWQLDDRAEAEAARGARSGGGGGGGRRSSGGSSGGSDRFRPATPEEAAPFGFRFGKMDTRTGNFTNGNNGPADQREPAAPDLKLSEGGKVMLNRALEDDFGAVEAQEVRAFEEEVLRQLRASPGMSEADAIRSAIERQNREQIETEEGGGLFRGPARTVTQPGRFDGTFAPATPPEPPAAPPAAAPAQPSARPRLGFGVEPSPAPAAQPAPPAPAPAAVPQQRDIPPPDPVMPSDLGMPRVTDDASYDRLPPGTTFMAPDGTIRVKP